MAQILWCSQAQSFVSFLKEGLLVVYKHRVARPPLFWWFFGNMMSFIYLLYLNGLQFIYLLFPFIYQKPVNVNEMVGALLHWSSDNLKAPNLFAVLPMIDSTIGFSATWESIQSCSEFHHVVTWWTRAWQSPMISVDASASAENCLWRTCVSWTQQAKPSIYIF